MSQNSLGSQFTVCYATALKYDATEATETLKSDDPLPTFTYTFGLWKLRVYCGSGQTFNCRVCRRIRLYKSANANGPWTKIDEVIGSTDGDGCGTTSDWNLYSTGAGNLVAGFYYKITIEFKALEADSDCDDDSGYDDDEPTELFIHPE